MAEMEEGCLNVTRVRGEQVGELLRRWILRIF